jgi:hypothetical protein
MITTSEMDANGEEASSVRDVAQGKNGTGGDAIREPMPGRVRRKERGEEMRLAELGPDSEGAERWSPERGTQIKVVTA